MDALEAIRTRRSIRKYKAGPVPEGLIHQLLAAAMMAPSARNQQPWQFVVINDRSLLAEYAKLHPTAEMASRAPLAILVCADLRLEVTPGYWPIDCAAAIQNMLLAAHAVGLGGVWTGVYPRQERMATLKQLCRLPDEVIPHSFIVLGYPGESPVTTDRYSDERLHRNQWA